MTVTDADPGTGVEGRSPWQTVAFGALLGAGVTAAATRLRRRRSTRLAPGTRPVDPPDAAVGAETVLGSSDAVTEIATLSHLMRTLTPCAREEPNPPLGRAVQLTATGVEVLFNRRAVVPPLGWETTNG